VLQSRLPICQLLWDGPHGAPLCSLPRAERCRLARSAIYCPLIFLTFSARKLPNNRIFECIT
jgi:hypothetical protein